MRRLRNRKRGNSRAKCRKKSPKQAEAEVVPSSSSVKFKYLKLSRCNLDANLMKLDAS